MDLGSGLYECHVTRCTIPKHRRGKTCGLGTPEHHAVVTTVFYQLPYSIAATSSHPHKNSFFLTMFTSPYPPPPPDPRWATPATPLVSSGAVTQPKRTSMIVRVTAHAHPLPSQSNPSSLSNDVLICSKMIFATPGGTALPICFLMPTLPNL